MPTKRTPQSRRKHTTPRAYEHAHSRRTQGTQETYSRSSVHSQTQTNTCAYTKPRKQQRTSTTKTRKLKSSIRKSNTEKKTVTYRRRETSLNRTLGQTAFTLETQAGDIAITRRHLLVGAGITAGIAVAAAGGFFVYSQTTTPSSSDFEILSVSEDAVSTNSSLTTVESDGYLSLIGSYELTYGTQVWANSDLVAACLVPGETSTPLTTVELLWLDSATTQTVLTQAIGQSEGFNIYDVRASDQGIIWVEADILDGTWNVYTAVLTDRILGEAVLVDTGDSNWEMPQIAAVANKAFWQVLPRTDGNTTSESSILRAATMGSSETHIAYTSSGRMATPPYATATGVVITPRVDTSEVYYQLTYLDAIEENVLDSLILPVSMRPLEAGYGETGFMFSFDGTYSYGDGISQLGTYTPLRTTTGDEASSSLWFRYARTPSAAPAWCGPYLMVKSTTAVAGVNLEAGELFTLSVESGSDDYGDYLASTGTHNTVITFANIDDDPISGEARTCCLVRVWAPV